MVDNYLNVAITSIIIFVNFAEQTEFIRKIDVLEPFKSKISFFTGKWHNN
ncbi:MAG: hypothetical protein BWX96_02078 [Bacteroidetes bacterium ADurb.Bin145]|jgi:hypothetical protein|nr:MAG: hypothetical protein BWX96_02078 [Bacteroidetes bacterium ADurb.Bin145]